MLLIAVTYGLPFSASGKLFRHPGAGQNVAVYPHPISRSNRL